MPLFLVLVTFAAALAGLRHGPPGPLAAITARPEAQTAPMRSGAGIDDAMTALGRFAGVTDRQGSDEALILEIDPELVFEPGRPTVRREAMVLLFRLSQVLRDAAGGLRLRIVASMSGPMSPDRVSTLLDELRRLGVTDEHVAAGFGDRGSGPGLLLRLHGDLAP